MNASQKHTIRHAYVCTCFDCLPKDRPKDTGHLLRSPTSGDGIHHRKARSIECNQEGIWIVHFDYTNGDGGGCQQLTEWNRDVSSYDLAIEDVRALAEYDRQQEEKRNGE
jgi:hypothetical protein